MTQTTNYGLNIVEGSDVVNPLVQTNPNFETIDTTMKANEDKTVGTATEVKSGTVHAISRAKTNVNVFRFVATSDYRTGDTFTVDGNAVTATLVDGSNPKDRAFVIGTSVMCVLDGIRLTFVNCEGAPSNIDAINVDYDNSVSGLTATTAQGAIDELHGADVSMQTDISNLKSGVVLHTANANQTFAQQIAELKPYFDSLTDGQKMHCALRDGLTLVPCGSLTGVFTVTALNATSVSVVCYYMTGATYASSNNVIRDLTNNNNNTTLSLVVV